MSGALELGLDSEESLRRENALESAPCPVQCPASEGPRSSWPAGDGVERNCVLKRGRCRDRNVSVLGGRVWRAGAHLGSRTARGVRQREVPCVGGACSASGVTAAASPALRRGEAQGAVQHGESYAPRGHRRG